MSIVAFAAVLALSATPAERHAAFLKLHLDGSMVKLEAMKAELNELSGCWAKQARSENPALRERADRKRDELIVHFADELARSPVPPEIVRMGTDAVEAFKEELRESAARIREASK